MGYAYPTGVSESGTELTEAEKDFVRSLANRAAATEEIATQSNGGIVI